MEKETRQLANILKLSLDLGMPKSKITFLWHKGVIKEVAMMGKMPIFDFIDTAIALKAYELGQRERDRYIKPDSVQAVLR